MLPLLSTPTEDWLTTAAAVFGVFATFAAVVVALFGEDIRRGWRGPVLTLVYERSDDHVVTDGGRKRTDYRLRVKNEASRTPAQHVHAVVTDIWRVEPGERSRIMRTKHVRQLQLPLTWAYSRPPEAEATVYGGVDKLLDFAEVFGDARQSLRLQVVPEPRDDIAELVADMQTEWELSVVLVADGVKPQRYSVVVLHRPWEGVWIKEVLVR